MKAVFSHKCKIAGILLVVAATCITVFFVVYRVGISGEGLSVLLSAGEAKFFEIQKNSFADEMILLLFIGGFTLIVFSKEKKELKILKTVRIKALFKTILVYTVWMAVVVLFSSGKKFMILLTFNMILPHILYLAFFYHTKSKELKRRRLHKIQWKILKSIS